jgi:hypothetical protein
MYYVAVIILIASFSFMNTVHFGKTNVSGTQRAFLILSLYLKYLRFVGVSYDDTE